MEVRKTLMNHSASDSQKAEYQKRGRETLNMNPIVSENSMDEIKTGLKSILADYIMQRDS